LEVNADIIQTLKSFYTKIFSNFWLKFKKNPLVILTLKIKISNFEKRKIFLLLPNKGF